MPHGHRRSFTRLRSLLEVSAQVSQDCFISQRHFFIRAQTNRRFLSTVRLRLQSWRPNAPRPRNIHEIDSLRIIKYTSDMEESDNERCSICLSRKKRNELIVKLPCNHLFHSNCFKRLMHSSTVCPLCRRNFYFH